jgi:hypothetical protein
MALGLLPWVPQQFFDSDGNPLAGGFVHFYEAGSMLVDQDTYEDSDGVTANPNPIELDTDGRPPDPIFILPTGYLVQVLNADLVQQYVVDNVSDPGAVFAANFGTVTSAGSQDVNSGYTVLATDWLVTIDATESTNPCIINLPSATDYTNALTIKNYATVAVSIVPNGSETIDSIAGAYSLDAAASPNFPAVTLISDHVSAWTIVSSHGITV